MILGTSWPQPLQFGALGALVAIGIFLIFYKRDRLTQDKTPLPKAKYSLIHRVSKPRPSPDGRFFLPFSPPRHPRRLRRA